MGMVLALVGGDLWAQQQRRCTVHVSPGRPVGTTKKEGYGVSSGRPVGTTAEKE